MGAMKRLVFLFALALAAAASAEETPLINAAMLGDNDAVKAALAKGADVNAKGDGRPAIVWAAQNGWIDVVQTLVAAKADVNLRDNIGLTALERAVDVGAKPAMVALLIKAGADVNLKYGEPQKSVYPGRSVLMTASSSGNREIVDLLLKAKPDVNATDDDGETALTIAVEDGHPELIATLAKAGANMNIAYQHWTPLLWAIENANAAAIDELLKVGADPNKAGENGESPLMVAVTFKSAPTVAKLIAAKADVNAKDRSGYTALRYARENEDEAMVEMLVKAGAKE
jgi:ankyrin repeat protein